MPSTVVVPTLTGTGPTFRELYLDLADELGFISETTVSTQATNVESARTVFTLDALDDFDPEGDGAWSSWWLYVVDGAYAGAQRRVLSRGHLGNEGALLLDRPLPSTLTANTMIILTSPLPITKRMGIDGLKQMVNKGLNRCRIGGRIPFDGTGLDSYSLNGYDWLRSASQTTGLYDRLPNIATSNAAQRSGVRYEITTDGADITLVTSPAYASGTAFELGVIVRGDRLIFDGAAWGYAATPGLVDDDDMAAVPMEWVRAFSMVKALQHLDRVLQADRHLDKETKMERRQIVAERKPIYVRAANRISLTGFPEGYSQSKGSLVGLDAGPFGSVVSFQ